MKITWIGHACFKLEQDGAVIVTDPYEADYVPGLSPVKETADGVYFSHFHKDHYTEDAVQCGGTGHLPEVTKLQTWHDDEQGAKRGENTVHIFRFGDEKVIHLGDLGCRPEEAQMELLKDADVLLIPVGGFFTIDAKQAAALVRELHPRIAVPMHYRDDALGFGYELIGTAEPFAGEFSCVEYVAGCTFDTADVKRGIVVLQPQNLIKKEL